MEKRDIKIKVDRHIHAEKKRFFYNDYNFLTDCPYEYYKKRKSVKKDEEE